MIEDVQEKHVGKWRQDKIDFTWRPCKYLYFSCSLIYHIGGKNITAKGATWLKLKDLKPLPTTTTTTEITTADEEGPETEGYFEV